MNFVLENTFNINRIDPEVASKELMRLATKHKALTPRIVLEAARDPANPLHAAFDWDDQEAAEKWRLHQARALIRSVRVVVEERETRPMFVHVAPESGYQPLSVVVKNPSLFARALAEANDRLAAAERAVSDLEKAAKIEASDPERLLRIAAAARAMEMARVAISALH